MRVESLLDKAKFVLDDAATLWLHSPVKALDDQTPLSLMDTYVGCSEVDLVRSTLAGRGEHCCTDRPISGCSNRVQYHPQSESRRFLSTHCE